VIAPGLPPTVANAPQIGVCGAGYCDRPAVAYVSRTVGVSRRVTIIIGPRGEFLGEQNQPELRCFDCLHDEVDTALASTGIPVHAAERPPAEARADRPVSHTP